MFTPSLLASGQLPSSKGTLYLVLTGMRCRVTTITLFNTTGGALTCNIYINSGSSREIWRGSVATISRTIVIDVTAPIFLDAAAIVEGLCGSATSVNYHIFGETEQKG